MATLEHLVAVGKLQKHEPTLERGDFPDRHVYLAPVVVAWMSVTLWSAARDRSRRLTPYEQVDQLLYDFIIGRPLVYDSQRKKLDPYTQHVWELKTHDVRLIGWFAGKGRFVIVCGRFKKEMPKARLYSSCVTMASWFRANLDLDEPRAVMGVNYNELL